jgi:hypothetical protein
MNYSRFNLRGFVDNKASAFYQSFSLAELIATNLSLLEVDRTQGGGGGGGNSITSGAGIGGGSGSAGRMNYHKSVSETVTLKPGSFTEHEETRFIRALKDSVAGQLTRTGAELDGIGSLSPHGLQLDYYQSNVKGLIEISGQLHRGHSNASDFYTLSATLRETFTDTNAPKLRRPTLRQQSKPPGIFYVVTFPPGDPRSTGSNFWLVGRELIQASNMRVAQWLSDDFSRHDQLLSLEHAEVYVWEPQGPTKLRQDLAAFAEFEGLGKVYFLNEAAIKMYRDAGEKFEIRKIISADNLGALCGPPLRGPYLPKGKS